MNKKLILSLSTVALLTTSLFANMQEEPKMPNNEMKKDMHMPKMEKPRFEHKKGEFIIGKIMMLDLSKEQKESIKNTIDSFKNNMPNPYEAFSEDGFDKEKFVESQRDMFKFMIKNRADLIEKVYALLTKEQKKDLKTILDMDIIMKKKRLEDMMGKKSHKPEFRG